MSYQKLKIMNMNNFTNISCDTTTLKISTYNVVCFFICLSVISVIEILMGMLKERSEELKASLQEISSLHLKIRENNNRYSSVERNLRRSLHETHEVIFKMVRDANKIEEERPLQGPLPNPYPYPAVEPEVEPEHEETRPIQEPEPNHQQHEEEYQEPEYEESPQPQPQPEPEPDNRFHKEYYMRMRSMRMRKKRVQSKIKVGCMRKWIK